MSEHRKIDPNSPNHGTTYRKHETRYGYEWVRSDGRVEIYFDVEYKRYCVAVDDYYVMESGAKVKFATLAEAKAEANVRINDRTIDSSEYKGCRIVVYSLFGRLGIWIGRPNGRHISNYGFTTFADAKEAAHREIDNFAK